jgi:sugar phosphate isomerase/epimerase
MRAGVVGLMPADLRDVTPEVARRVRDHGFTGVSCVLRDPFAYEQADFERTRATLADAGVRVAQANARYPDLIHPDADQRAAGLRALRQACVAARWLEADTVYVRPGSLNPAGSWTPHPENTHPRTLARLIVSLKAAAAAAEDLGVTLALEGHVVSSLDTPERLREVFEAVGSSALRHNVDPVNMIGGLRDAYDTTAFLGRLFAVLGPYIVAAHAKDLRVENRLVLHLEECVIGEGLLDQATFLDLFEAACPDGYVLIEHLPDDQVPAAKRALDAAAERAGLTWRA